jgi:hypothetical protein
VTLPAPACALAGSSAVPPSSLPPALVVHADLYPGKPGVDKGPNSLPRLGAVFDGGDRGGGLLHMLSEESGIPLAVKHGWLRVRSMTYHENYQRAPPRHRTATALTRDSSVPEFAALLAFVPGTAYAAVRALCRMWSGMECHHRAAARTLWGTRASDATSSSRTRSSAIPRA